MYENQDQSLDKVTIAGFSSLPPIPFKAIQEELTQEYK
jgi:hypothetical protein